jgi:ankyrin repeat protein
MVSASRIIRTVVIICSLAIFAATWQLSHINDRDGRGSGINTTIYEECVRLYSLPMRDPFYAAPITQLNTKERNTLLGCATNSGSVSFLRWVLMDTKEMLSIESRFDGRWPLENVARWTDGSEAREALGLLLEPNPNLWKINSSASLMVALYEARTPHAAHYLAKKYDFLVKADNQSLFDRNDSDSDKYRSLTLAQYHALEGRLNVAEVYADMGSKVTTPGVHLRHLLFEKDGHNLPDEQMDAFLVDHGSTLDERDDQGHTLLYAAEELGDKNLVMRLIAKGADVKEVEAGGKTLLHEAARNNHPDLVALLATHINPNVLNNKGQTPLYDAFAAGSWDAASVLLEHGARLDVRDTLGRTPLFECVQHGCPVLDQLVVKGADINVHDNRGDSLLFAAAVSNDHDTMMVQGLIDRGIMIDAKNGEGRTALFESVLSNNLSLVNLFLARGAKVNVRDNLGNTPLHLATSKEMVGALLEAGADPDRPNNGRIRPVDGDLAHAAMMFHSPSLINSKMSTLVRYFKVINLEGSGNLIALSTPTEGFLGPVTDSISGQTSSGQIEFLPRSPDMQFRLQVACQEGVRLQVHEPEEKRLVLDHLLLLSPWKDALPLEGKPGTYRVAINPMECMLLSPAPSTVLDAIQQKSPDEMDLWKAAGQECSQTQPEKRTSTSGGCTLLLRPVARVLVKVHSKWNEVGILRTLDTDVKEPYIQATDEGSTPMADGESEFGSPEEPLASSPMNVIPSPAKTADSALTQTVDNNNNTLGVSFAAQAKELEISLKKELDELGGSCGLNKSSIDAENYYRRGKILMELNDYKPAMICFLRSQEVEMDTRTFKESCSSIGLMYELGWGVEKNMSAAKEWYRKAGLQN